MPGSGETRPKPVFCAMTAHPDHLGRGRGGQDQQRPGPHSPARPDRRRGPVPASRSGGPRRDRTTQTVVRNAGRAGSHGSHACHHPSAVASG